MHLHHSLQNHKITMAKINKDDILIATEGGKAVILEYYPQASVGFSSRRNFKLRPDDKNPSATVFLKDNIWFVQDKGGSDNKAYTAISLVMEMEGLTFPQALEKIASRYAPHLLDDKPVGFGPKPMMEKTVATDEILVSIRKGGQFTLSELSLLGYKIDQKTCDAFNLKPVDYYITKRNEKGVSWKIISTEEYPIYFYDYGSFGKLYQPLGELRFMWTGSKPDNLISGNDKFLHKYKDALKGNFPELDEVQHVDERWEDLIICSGPSDALNVYSAGYHVCWLNSESAKLTAYEFSLLTRTAKNVYICYDIDETGIRKMYELALSFLDLKLIILPESLRKFRTRGGKSAKDAKDFMVHYRRPDIQNPHKLFSQIVKLSYSLKFWIEKRNNKGEFSGYDVNNEQLYAFLNACGFWKIETSSNKKGFTFCFVKDNIVELIDEDSISATCSNYLIQYLKDHPEYYSQQLVNSLHRSNQIKLSSLEKLKFITPNFQAYDKVSDAFFFKNTVARVTATGIEAIKPGNSEYYVYKHKIIDHEFSVEKPLFEVNYTEHYATLHNRLNSGTLLPLSPEFIALKKQIDALPDTDKYEVQIHDWDFSFLKYIYNTGRAYWRKEELNLELSDIEQKEVDLHFINKITALGYMLYKHKDAGQAWGIYAMEMEGGDVGSHLGGTGKSLFMSSIEYVRKQLFLNGQDLNMSNPEFMFAGVERNITDHVFFDDLNEFVDLHRFMPMITGKMTVNAKYQNAFVLDYKDSPKVGFTSNHGIKNFDASLRRRTWFTAFSSYYHPEDPMKGLRVRSPYTEFRKNLITDYTPGEMNKFYNFMLSCLQAFLKFRDRIQPPMDQIEKRNIQRAITDEFIWWAEDYFNETRLNCLINKHDAFESYKATLNEKTAKLIKINTFKNRLVQFCQFKEWNFNPSEMLKTETEKERNEIRVKEDGEDKYYYFISTLPVAENSDIDIEFDGDLPPV